VDPAGTERTVAAQPTARTPVVGASVLGASVAEPGAGPGAVPVTPVTEPGAGRSWLRRPFDPGAVTLGELAIFAAGTAVAVLALVSLAAAHLGVHRLSTILPATAVLLAVLGVLAWFGARPRIVADLAGLVQLGAAGLLSAWMFLPGFHYVAGDRDPGGYVMHAFAIARHGSYTFTDQLLSTPGLPVQLAGPNARFPAVWVQDMATGQIVPQFYHLWPALMATSYELRGYGGLANTGPVAGVLAVLLGVAVARRVGGAVAGYGTALLLATNMMEVWQAKYPTAEILAQLLYLGALLGIILAVATRWRWPALVAGMLVGIGYLDRADGLLLVLAAVGGLAALWVLRRFDARAGYFLVGLAALLPYGLYQAYGPAGTYSRLNDIPRLSLVLAVIGACVVGALVLRVPLAPLARWLDGRLTDERNQRRAGVVLMLGALGVFALGLVRPLFGRDYGYYGPRLYETFDERSLYRLSWFFSWPGLLLMLVGVGYVLLRRWSAPAWLVAGLTVGLLVLYCWHSRNSPYFMWVGRRFVPAVVPGMVMLIALGLAWIWLVRWPGRVRIGPPLALAFAGFLAAVQLNQSLPLRSHDEWGGGYGVTRSVAALAGNQQGIYLWQPAAHCCAAPQTVFGSPLWLVADQQSALLPGKPADVPAYVRAYLRRFSGQPVFLVYDRDGRPPAMPGLAVTPVRRFTERLPHWAESSISRPASAVQVPFDFTVYQVRPAPRPAGTG
jgi:hypothetical protein